MSKHEQTKELFEQLLKTAHQKIMEEERQLMYQIKKDDTQLLELFRNRQKENDRHLKKLKEATEYVLDNIFYYLG